MTVTRFKMGADIPEWLLTLEPRSVESRRENFRFAIDVDVIETDDNFIVVPALYGHYATMIDMSGTHDCNMFAPGKVTRMAVHLHDVFAQGMVPIVPLAPPMQAEVIERTDTHVVLSEPMPDPHRTFWQRLRYAFTGR